MKRKSPYKFVSPGQTNTIQSYFEFTPKKVASNTTAASMSTAKHANLDNNYSTCDHKQPATPLLPLEGKVTYSSCSSSCSTTINLCSSSSSNETVHLCSSSSSNGTVQLCSVDNNDDALLVLSSMDSDNQSLSVASLTPTSKDNDRIVSGDMILPAPSKTLECTISSSPSVIRENNICLAPVRIIQQNVSETCVDTCGNGTNDTLKDASTNKEEQSPLSDDAGNQKISYSLGSKEVAVETFQNENIKLKSLCCSYIPRIRDRFRISFIIGNCFGSGRKFETWFFATATSISKKNDGSYKLKVLFDDHTSNTNVTYPGRNIERLTSDPDAGESNSSLVYAVDVDGVRHMAYDTNPKELFVGDLVQCHYQNGLGQGLHSDAWYLGLVAVVKKNGTLFDVAYFDGSYEEDVPLMKGTVYLVERASKDRNFDILEDYRPLQDKVKKWPEQRMRSKAITTNKLVSDIQSEFRKAPKDKMQKLPAKRSRSKAIIACDPLASDIQSKSREPINFEVQKLPGKRSRSKTIACDKLVPEIQSEFCESFKEKAFKLPGKRSRSKPSDKLASDMQYKMSEPIHDEVEKLPRKRSRSIATASDQLPSDIKRNFSEPLKEKMQNLPGKRSRSKANDKLQSDIQSAFCEPINFEVQQLPGKRSRSKAMTSDKLAKVITSDKLQSDIQSKFGRTKQDKKTKHRYNRKLINDISSIQTSIGVDKCESEQGGIVQEESGSNRKLPCHRSSITCGEPAVTGIPDHKWERDENDDYVFTEVETDQHAKRMRELDPHFAKKLWNALNSPEPHNGYGLLVHMVFVFNQGPSQTSIFMKNLLDYIIEGPKFEGKKIYDTRRTELLFSYVGMLREPCIPVPPDWQYIEAILQLPLENFYGSQMDSNEDFESAFLLRMQTVQFSSKSLQYLSTQISNELKLSLKQKVLSKAKKAYETKPICTCAINFGIRDALKISLRYFMKCWIQCEVDRRMIVTTDITADLDGLCCMQIFQDCLDSLGAIVCCLAWCYCVEQGSTFGCDDCGYLFQEIIETEIKASQLPINDADKVIRVISAEQDLYFRVIMSINSPFCIHVRAMIAKRFNLMRLLASVCGYD